MLSVTREVSYETCSVSNFMKFLHTEFQNATTETKKKSRIIKRDLHTKFGGMLALLIYKLQYEEMVTTLKKIHFQLYGRLAHSFSARKIELYPPHLLIPLPNIVKIAKLNIKPILEVLVTSKSEVKKAINAFVKFGKMYSNKPDASLSKPILEALERIKAQIRVEEENLQRAYRRLHQQEVLLISRKVALGRSATLIQGSAASFQLSCAFVPMLPNIQKKEGLLGNFLI